jgi:hypothetical protein
LYVIFISCSFQCICCNLLSICWFCIPSVWPYHLSWGDFINFTISALPLSHFFLFSSTVPLLWIYIFSLWSSIQIFSACLFLLWLLYRLLTCKSVWVIFGVYVVFILCFEIGVSIWRVCVLVCRTCYHNFGINICPHFVFIAYNWFQVLEAVNTFKFKITYCQLLEISSYVCRGHFSCTSFSLHWLLIIFFCFQLCISSKSIIFLIPFNCAKVLWSNKYQKNSRHFYKFKKPTQMEIFGSRKRICPGKKRMYVSPTLS